MNKTGTTHFKIHCLDIGQNISPVTKSGRYKVEIWHREGDPENANRIRISRKDLELEILPSKGMSVGKFSIDGEEVFWEPPQGLPDPDRLDFNSRDVYIFGEQVAGYEFLKTFVGGIELMGLDNWGMPVDDSEADVTLPLHGEVGNIPVDWIDFELDEAGLTARGSFLFRSLSENDEEIPWYMNGRELYRVTRTLIIRNDVLGFILADTITNVSGKALIPDWGYHVTFRPEEGSKLLVASKELEERGGGPVPEDHDTWNPAEDERIRTETGIIHKGLKLFDSQGTQGTPATRILKIYPDGRAFELCIPPSPYFQTWSSRGGSDSEEFTFRDGTRLFSRPWNGFGVEFGSSALDHNGNIDTSVQYNSVLNSGESLKILISVREINKKKAERFIHEIRRYRSE